MNKRYLGILSVFVLLPAELCASSITLLKINSQAGDIVGNGSSYSYTTGTFHLFAFSTQGEGAGLPPTYATLEFMQVPPGDFWTLQFASGTDNVLLPGLYMGATSNGGYGGVPLLGVGGLGRGCDSVGTFNVIHANLVANGVLDVPGTSFAATFEQHCGNSLTGPALTGTIYYNYDPILAPISIGPANGNANSQTFSVTFSDPNGWQNLQVVDVLINNVLDGRQACYVAFVPSGANSGSVFLVDDSGDAGGPYSGMVLPGNGMVQNSQCTINGAGSSVNGSDNTLTLTLDISFSSAFQGNKVTYMAAQDSGGNSGWQALGTWSVPTPAPVGPAVGGMDPARSGSVSQAYAFAFTDTNGWQDIAVTDILINSAIDGQQACYVAFVPSGANSGSVLLVDDAGDAGGPYSGMVLPGTGTVQNSQCAINGTGSSVVASGNTLTLNLAVTFSPSFTGNRVFYLAARNNSAGNSGWQAVGSVTVP